MDISIAYGDCLGQATPLLVLGAWEDEALPHAVADLVEAEDWSGRLKQTLTLYPHGALPARRVLLVGLGKRSQTSAERLREAAAVAAQRARDLKVDRYLVELPTTDGLTHQAAAQALVEGSLLGLYRFQAYKTDFAPDDQHEITKLTIISQHTDDGIQQGVDLGTAIARGVALARDLANGPGNDITPAKLGEIAEAIGERTNLRVTVLDQAELKQQGFGGLLGVAQGSEQLPRFIIMEHGSTLANVPTICLVGKGITFDSGGISIKPAENMDEMKTDMSGPRGVGRDAGGWRDEPAAPRGRADQRSREYAQRYGL